MSAGGPVTIPDVAEQLQHSFAIDLRNVGPANIYVARAYFRPKLRRWWFLWLRRSPTRLKVHPQAFRIASKDAFALAFKGEQAFAGQQVFTEHETLIRPVPPTTVRTWLPLTEEVRQKEIEKRRCGVLYVEYATSGKQGLHVVRL
jgi:hypothetical protein